MNATYRLSLAILFCILFTASAFAQKRKPAFANPAQPLEVSLAATLLEDPYDDFKVVDPFSLKVLISAPTALAAAVRSFPPFRSSSICFALSAAN